MSREVDFERLRKVFTTENADKKFRPDDPLKPGEVFSVYFTPELEPEEITVFRRDKYGDEYQYTIIRIFQDALLYDYDWDKLNWEYVEEIVFSEKEFKDLCKFTQ